MLYPIFWTLLSEPIRFLRSPLIQKTLNTTHKTHDSEQYPPYHAPHKKHFLSYFTPPTLISEPPTFLTRGWTTTVERDGRRHGATVLRNIYLGWQFLFLRISHDPESCVTFSVVTARHLRPCRPFLSYTNRSYPVRLCVGAT